MNDVGTIHSSPIEDYKLVYNYLQAFSADFDFNEEQPIEKIKLLALIHQLSKCLYDEYCESSLRENAISQDDLNNYLNQLMLESLK